MAKKHVYTVEANVRFSAKGHGSLWCGESLTVLANGDVNSAMKKAKAHMMTLTTPDGAGGNEYMRRATKVEITSVVQGAEVDLL